MGIRMLLVVLAILEAAARAHRLTCLLLPLLMWPNLRMPCQTTLSYLVEIILKITLRTHTLAQWKPPISLLFLFTLLREDTAQG